MLRGIASLCAIAASVWVAGCDEQTRTHSGAGGSTTGTSSSESASVSVSSGSGGTNPAGSRCTINGATVTCEHQMTHLDDSNESRTVLFETPLGTPPAAGWPAVLYFQGSFVAGHTSFQANKSDSFGAYDLTLTIKALLDRGYAVIAPDAASNGSTYWETNIPPYSLSWSDCPDDILMNHLFGALSSGALGPLDSSRLYAMGISSGGFMTSRMAVSYPGKFRALVDHSGSYATCSNVCSVPTPLPTDHPPTLFLHGDQDAIVPMSAITPYFDALSMEGHETKVITDPSAGHQWLSEGPVAIPNWFDSHP